MEIVILNSYDEVCREVADRIILLVRRKPNAVLGLATGKTMLGVYRYLVKAYEEGLVDFSRVTTFNLDEYLGVLPVDPESFHYYMEENFFKHVNLKKENIFIPSPFPEDLQEECENYEKKIKEKGGIDLQLLGIGRDGHIGFNEPSSSLTSRTRVKTLTEQTLKDNFPEGKGPRFAITMGLGTIMEAKEIILAACGREKAEAVAAAVEGPISSSCPASVLQMHPRAHIILDREAASLLKRKDYYLWVFRHKKEVEKENYFPEGTVKVKVPARICLFGEHQDYLGLPVISAAVNLYMRVVGRKNEERKASFYLFNFDDKEEFELNFPVPYRKERDYFRSVFNVLRRQGIDFQWGVKGAVSSRIPISAGASSSSALVVSLIKLLLELAGDPRKDDPETLAELAFEAEVAEFKEPGGKMDHYTCALGGVLFIDFSDGKVERIRSKLEGFVLADSMQPKETKRILSRAKGGQLEALKRLRQIYPAFDLRKTSYEEIKELLAKLPIELRPFAEAAIRNRELTLRGRELLKNDCFDSYELGKLLLEHHGILRDFLEVSTPTIEKMMEEALKAGALGGKVNGSGGGGTVFFYAPGREQEVKEAMERMGKPAFVVEISRGTFVY